MFARQFAGRRRRVNRTKTALANEETSSPQKAVEDETKAEDDCICNRQPQDILCKACGYNFIGRVRRKCPMHSAILLMDFVYCPSCQADQLHELKISTTPQKPEDVRVENVLKEWRERRPSSKGNSQQPNDVDSWEDCDTRPVHTQTHHQAIATSKMCEEEDWDIKPATTQTNTQLHNNVTIQDEEWDIRPADTLVSAQPIQPIKDSHSIDQNSQRNIISAHAQERSSPVSTLSSSPLSIAGMKGVGRGMHSGARMSALPISSPVQTSTPPVRNSTTLPTYSEVGLSPSTIIRKTLFLKNDKSNGSGPSAMTGECGAEEEAKFNIVVHSTGKLGERFSNNVVDMERHDTLGGGDAVVNTSRKNATDGVDDALTAFCDLNLGVKR